MALTSGLSITCPDIEATGGIDLILLREWNSTGSPDLIELGSGTHTVTSIQKSGPANANWGVYEFKIETGQMTVTGNTEMGVSTYECAVSFMIPKMDLDNIDALQTFNGKCLQVIARDTNGTFFVLGISDTLTGGDFGLDIPAASHIGTRPQTFAKLMSMEGGTGQAFADDNGLTVTIGCTQYELPRTYTGTVTLSGTTATTT